DVIFDLFAQLLGAGDSGIGADVRNEDGKSSIAEAGDDIRGVVFLPQQRGQIAQSHVGSGHAQSRLGALGKIIEVDVQQAQVVFFGDVVDGFLKVVDHVLAVVQAGDHILPLDLFDLLFQHFIIHIDAIGTCQELDTGFFIVSNVGHFETDGGGGAILFYAAKGELG